MSNLNAKLAKQIANANATQTSIDQLTKLAKASKDDTYRMNANLILVQLHNKLKRQTAAVKLTQFQIDNNL